MTFSRIEPLESRIAPAGVSILNSHTASYTDTDGDTVMVKVSSGSLALGNFQMQASGLGWQLQTLDLHNGGFDGANISFSVIKAVTGDGLVNVGYINSTGHNLGAVTVKGDLGKINAGGGSGGTTGLKALNVQSMGRLGTDTQDAGGSLLSTIYGRVGSLNVKGDIQDASVLINDIPSTPAGTTGLLGSATVGGSIIGGAIRSYSNMGPVKVGHDLQGSSGSSTGEIFSFGRIAKVSIGGSVIGGTGQNSGTVIGFGELGPVTVAGNLVGGGGDNSGAIGSITKVDGVKIGGSIQGGDGDDSGMVTSAKSIGTVQVIHDIQGGAGSFAGSISAQTSLQTVTIGGSLRGGTGNATGCIFSNGGDIGTIKIGHDIVGNTGGTGIIKSFANLASVTVGGSLLGGTGNGSGAIAAVGQIGSIKINGDVIGTSISGSAGSIASAYIEAGTHLGTVFVGGSVITGTDNSTGNLVKNASIRAGNDIGSLTIKGSLVGHDSCPVIISADGQAVQGTSTDLAIKTINIGGRVQYTNIVAGYDTSLTPDNGDAQVGPVKVAGDWVASSIAAGASNTSSTNTQFGNNNDALISGANPAIISRIASITIGGGIFGTPSSVNPNDSYGFVAQQVGPVKVGGVLLALNGNPALGEPTDMVVHVV